MKSGQRRPLKCSKLIAAIIPASHVSEETSMCTETGTSAPSLRRCIRKMRGSTACRPSHASCRLAPERRRLSTCRCANWRARFGLRSSPRNLFGKHPAVIPRSSCAMRARPFQHRTEHPPRLLVKNSLESVVGQLRVGGAQKLSVHRSCSAPCEKFFLQIQAPPNAASGV